MVYLDNAATTPPCKAAIDKINEMLTKNFANALSLHKAGFYAEEEVNKTRKLLASAIGAGDDEIIFTSGGTESNNIAILGAAYANKKRGNRVITTDSEHPSVLNCFKNLEKQGYDVVYLPYKDGSLDIEKLRNSINSDTILISTLFVNNETGVINPVNIIKKIVNEKKSNAIIHVDAVQAFCKIPFSVSVLGADLLSISAHKFHGVKGAGALYIKKGTLLSPINFGGGQERGLRNGTLNSPAIAAMGAAINEFYNNINENYKYVSELNKYLRSEIKANVRDSVINSPDNASPYVLNLSLPGLMAETILHFLEDDKIYVSTTSACSSRKRGISYVLSAMGLEERVIKGAIRVSLSPFNTKNDIDQLVKGLIKCRETLKSN